MPRTIPLPASLRAHWAQPARCRYAPGASYDLHRHGFAEVFWIERGTCRHRTPDADVALAAGDLVFIHPDRVHGFQAPADHGFIMVNVVLRRELVDELSERYREDLSGWPWRADGKLPSATCSPTLLVRLAQWAEELSRDGSRLAAEGFVIDLLRRLCSPGPMLRPGLPSWLEEAIAAFSTGGGMAEGLAGFIALTGHSTAHVNRTVRAHLGRTATELVNDLRLDHAASRLRLTDQGILPIALACGYASLSHFYRAFHRRHGLTPRRWREQQWAVASARM